VPPSLTSTILGPDDDDSDDDAAMAQETEDLVLCQFERVAHQKDQWKIVLKDGIIRVNKRDFVFSRAAGVFDW
jgi:transcription initiation factor TFIIA large subunit